MSILRKLLRLTSMHWSEALQYRADMLLWMLTETATPLISLAVWYTVAKNASSGPSPKETFTYYILVMLVVAITSAWGGFFLSMQILNGNIVQKLIKPISPFWGFIINNLTEKGVKLILPIPLFLTALWTFPQSFTDSMYQPSLWLFFLLSLMLAATLAFMIDIIFGLLAFWMEDAVQLRWYKDTLQMITSGILIPIAVMPAGIQSVVNKLPFRSIISTPVEIMLGRLNNEALQSALTTQLVWVVICGVIVTVMWKRGLKIYAPPGQ